MVIVCGRSAYTKWRILEFSLDIYTSVEIIKVHALQIEFYSCIFGKKNFWKRYTWYVIHIAPDYFDLLACLLYSVVSL